MKRKHINLFFVMLFVMTSLTSCLSDGDETIALENGKAKELIMRANWRIKEWRGNPPSGLGWKKDDVFKFENNGTFSKLPSDGNTHSWHWIVGSKDSDTPVGISIDGYEFGWNTWGSGLWTLYYPRTKPEKPSWIINLDGIGNNSGSENEEKPGNTGKHTAVDLGLSVKWATMNVGASKPEDYGSYFAWGETTTKTTYNGSTYKWCNGSSSTMTKYCTSSSYGTVDNKTTLELSDDAARANWGGSWRMPTKAEQDELCTQCTWTWTTQNGVYGRKVVGPNGNSIFLPAAGFRGAGSLYDAGSDGHYWSSSLFESRSYIAYELYFNSGDVRTYDFDRWCGQSVRAVCP